VRSVGDKLRAAAEPYLKPGETIEEVFIGQNRSMMKQILFGMIWNKGRLFVVTAERILVLHASMWTLHPKGVLAELPRSTRFGPPTGLTHIIQVNGRPVYVGRKFFKDIIAADGALEVPPVAA